MRTVEDEDACSAFFVRMLNEQTLGYAELLTLLIFQRDYFVCAALNALFTFECYLAALYNRTKLFKDLLLCFCVGYLAFVVFVGLCYIVVVLSLCIELEIAVIRLYNVLSLVS